MYVRSSFRLAVEVDCRHAIWHQFIEIDEGVVKGLHVMAITHDGEVALHEGQTLGVTKEDASFADADKMLLEGDPLGVIRGHWRDDNLEQLSGDGAIELGEHIEIHPDPVQDGEEAVVT